MAPVVWLSIVIIITLLDVLFLCVVVSEVPWLVVVGCMEQPMKKKAALVIEPPPHFEPQLLPNPQNAIKRKTNKNQRQKSKQEEGVPFYKAAHKGEVTYSCQ